MERRDGSNLFLPPVCHHRATLKAEQESEGLYLVAVTATPIVMLEPPQQLGTHRAISADRRLVESRVVVQVHLIWVAFEVSQNDRVPEIIVPTIDTDLRERNERRWEFIWCIIITVRRS